LVESKERTRDGQITFSQIEHGLGVWLSQAIDAIIRYEQGEDGILRVVRGAGGVGEGKGKGEGEEEEEGEGEGEGEYYGEVG
jgi:hypothetical protein